MADADYDDHGGLYDGDPQTPLPSRAAIQRWVRVAGALVSLGLIVGFAVWGYRLAVRDVTGVPVVQALEGPMRIAPEDPGGEIADHQGLSVNDIAEVGVAASMPERLVLAPRPVELSPEDAPGLGPGSVTGLAEVSTPLAAPGPGGAADLALAAEPPVESASPTEIAVDAALAEALGLAPAPAAPTETVAFAGLAEDLAEDLAADLATDPGLSAPASDAIAPANAITLSPRPRPRPARSAGGAAADAAAPATVAAAEMDPASIPLGTRLVQFGAFDTADEARAEWARLEASFADLMAGKSIVLQPAESGGRTFFRLRAHGFEDEADARRFCLAFVAQEAVCIPVPQR